MRSAIEQIQEMISSCDGQRVKIVDLKICTDMYRALEQECAPATPSEFFGVPIVVDPKMDDPDYVTGQRSH